MRVAAESAHITLRCLQQLDHAVERLRVKFGGDLDAPASGPEGPVTVPARSSASTAIAVPGVWVATVPRAMPIETASPIASTETAHTIIGR